MINFNEEIIDTLNDYFSNKEEYVESIKLSSYGFNIQFVNFDIQCNERVFAKIKEDSFVWEESPNSGPWGMLGRQLAKEASLNLPNRLKIEFQSGDFIEIETVVSQYESVIFKFPPIDGSIVMEVF